MWREGLSRKDGMKKWVLEDEFEGEERGSGRAGGLLSTRLPEGERRMCWKERSEGVGHRCRRASGVGRFGSRYVKACDPI